jgi:acyl-CoA dehydrogenase
LRADDYSTNPSELDAFRARARSWLRANARPRREETGEWGTGSDQIGVFHNLTFDEERAHLAALQAWQRTKFDAGFAGITWPKVYGGQDLETPFERVFREEEAAVATPVGHEAFDITMEIVAPTILHWGTDAQKDLILERTLRGVLLLCQLYSEPEAGSDLASLRTKAVREGDTWRISGQKVWTSGARHATYGYILCRSDPDPVSRHRGLTAFLVDMAAPGVEIRPILQMSGGASFNEVFLNDAVVDDSMRLGPVGGGWRVALSSLSFERMAGHGGGNDLLARFWRIKALARQVGKSGEPVARSRLADLFVRAKLLEWNTARVRSAVSAGMEPGPVGSVNKLVFGNGLDRASAVVTHLLGPRLVADTRDWGLYAWAEHVTSAPGMHIAGGTDEIQRNIIAERILGLPRS